MDEISFHDGGCYAMKRGMTASKERKQREVNQEYSILCIMIGKKRNLDTVNTQRRLEGLLDVRL